MTFDVNLQKEVLTAYFSESRSYWGNSAKSIYQQNGLLSVFKPNYSSYYLIEGTTSNFIKKIEDNLVKKENINLSTTLYFPKPCVFPRYKLLDSGFKRCIKVNKADYIVIPKNFKNYISTYTNTWEREFIYENKVYRFNAEGDNIITNGDKKKYNIYSIDKKKYVYTNCKKMSEFIYDVLNNYDKPFIKEEDLDELVSKQCLEKLDYDSLFSIYEMLNSTDRNSVELGCKLLPTFNFFEIKSSVAFVLFMTQDKWMSNKGANSVIFKTCLNSLKYPPRGYWNIELFFKANPFASDEDKNICKRFIEPWIKKEVDKALSWIISKCPYNVNLNVTVE